MGAKIQNSVASDSIFDEMVSLQKQINAFDYQKKQLEARLSELKELAVEKMSEKGEKTHRTILATFSLKDGYVRQEFDKTRFRDENTNLYNMYLKDVEVKGTIAIRLK